LQLSHFLAGFKKPFSRLSR